MLRPQRSGGALESDHDVNPMYRCLAPERGPEHIFFPWAEPGSFTTHEKRSLLGSGSDLCRNRLSGATNSPGLPGTEALSGMWAF